nr:ribonucleotide-diphosphate reductase large chain [Pandoravirus massiliensis]
MGKGKDQNSPSGRRRTKRIPDPFFCARQQLRANESVPFGKKRPGNRVRKMPTSGCQTVATPVCVAPRVVARGGSGQRHKETPLLALFFAFCRCAFNLTRRTFRSSAAPIHHPARARQQTQNTAFPHRRPPSSFFLSDRDHGRCDTTKSKKKEKGPYLHPDVMTSLQAAPSSLAENQKPLSSCEPTATSTSGAHGDASVSRFVSEEASLTAKLAALARLDPPLDPHLDLGAVVQRVIQGTCAGMTVTQGDALLAETAVSLSSTHIDYETLAARVTVSAMHARTPPRFSDAVAMLAANVHSKTGRVAPLVSKEVVAFTAEHRDALDAAIRHERDYDYTYFGLMTLQRGYLLHNHEGAVDRPQYMIMRVAIGHYGWPEVDDALQRVLTTYDMMSRHLYTSATPTLFNAGTPCPQNSSCFLLQMKEDSIDGIYDTLKQCAVISKSAGGVGFAAHKVRASGSYIAGANGNSNGLVPMLRVFNNTARYVDQCFTGDALVLTADRGPVPIGTLYQEAAAATAAAATAACDGSSASQGAATADGDDASPPDASCAERTPNKTTTVVPAASGIKVLSDDGRWCPLGGIVRHAPSARATYLVGAGTTLVPKWAMPSANALRFAHGVRLTGQHQVQVLCDVLDHGRPIVIADIYPASNQDDVNNINGAEDVNNASDDSDHTDEGGSSSDDDAGSGGDQATAHSGADKADHGAVSDQGQGATAGSGDSLLTDPTKHHSKAHEATLEHHLATLCERIDRGHVAPRMIDADQLVPGAVLCVPIPPQDEAPTTTTTNEHKASDWRLAGILYAATAHGASQICAESDGKTARFISTYLSVADPDGASSTPSKKGMLRWRIAHPGFAKARALAERASLASAPTSAIESFLRGVYEALEGASGETATALATTLRWLSLRLTRVAASHSLHAGVIASGKAGVLSCSLRPSPLCDAPLPDGTARPSVVPWSIVHGNVIHMPVESIDPIAAGNENDPAALAGSRAAGDDGALYDLEVDDPAHTYSVLGLGACHNGGGKRKGAFACYLEPWHADINEWIELKKNHGKEEDRARDLFYALWTCDLFMRRAIAGKQWSLFCPAEAPGLDTCHGAAFDALYEKYEREGRARSTIPARQLWTAILTAQIETGTPFVVYKDASNHGSNQQNLGTIVCSNLCTEIIQYSSPDECGTCNLSSVALPKFVVPDPRGDDRSGPIDPRYDDAGVALGMVFDHGALAEVVEAIVENINRVIDINYYPVPEARRSNLRHRPMGIGVQGLADVFAMMDLPWESAGARRLNRAIFETIYYAAVMASARLAATHGTYPSYREGTWRDPEGVERQGSPASCGFLHPDLWAASVNDARRWEGCDAVPLAPEHRRPFDPKAHESGRWDWDALRANVARHGLRNSLLVALMPTASTSQILGNTEATEVITNNIYTRRVLSGDFTVVNRHLVKRMMERGLWTPEFRNRLIAARGSLQGFSDDEVSPDLKALFKTVWEVSNRVTIDMAADRAPYVDQSQSLNLYCAEPTMDGLTSMHAYAWRRGLKTGMYYLRTKPAANAAQVTVEVAASAASTSTGQDTASTADTPTTDASEPDGGDVCYPGCESCSG